VQRLLSQLNIKIGIINRNTVRTLHARLRAIVREALPHIPQGTTLPEELWQIVENPTSMRTVLSQYYDITCFKNTFFHPSTLRMAGCTEAETDREKMEKIRAILPTLTRLKPLNGPLFDLSQLPSLHNLEVDPVQYRPCLKQLRKLHTKKPNLEIIIRSFRVRKSFHWLPGVIFPRLTRLLSLIRNTKQESPVPINGIISLAGQNLTVIPPEIFSPICRIQVLILSHNKFRSLPSKISDLPDLLSIFLHGNPLESLPPELSQINTLRALFLDSRQITRFRNELQELKIRNPNLVIFALPLSWIEYFSSGFRWWKDRDSLYFIAESPLMHIFRQKAEQLLA